MFGLTFEKLVVVLVIAAIIIGPQRLPDYARRLSDFIRVVRDSLDSAKSRAEEETGLTADDWKALDPRQYDPRRIMRDALLPSPVVATDGASLAPEEVLADRPPLEHISAVSMPVNRSTRVSGSSGHPRRLLDAVAPAAEDAPSSRASE